MTTVLKYIFKCLAVEPIKRNVKPTCLEIAWLRILAIPSPFHRSSYQGPCQRMTNWTRPKGRPVPHPLCCFPCSPGALATHYCTTLDTLLTFLCGSMPTHDKLDGSKRPSSSPSIQFAINNYKLWKHHSLTPWSVRGFSWNCFWVHANA